MINVGIVGCGYWGPKLIRNFYELPDSNLALVCDLDKQRLEQVKKQYPHVETTTCFSDLLHEEIDAVVVATPVKMHYEMVGEALNHRKHVFVEKPMTASSREARHLIDIASAQRRILMVGHIYEYHPAIDFLKQLIKKGELGEIFAIDAHRLNLGLFRPDVNVMWDLGPHDLSIVLSLMGEEPVSVSARGTGHLNPDLCDLAYLELVFPSGATANIHLSWLDPRKVRQITIIGSRKMAFFDDVAEAEKVYLYDKGCALTPCPEDGTSAAWPPKYHYGDVTIPFISNAEPLKIECNHFLTCIKEGKRPKTDGLAGLQIISILEAANHSMQNGGQRINLYSVLDSVRETHRQLSEVR